MSGARDLNLDLSVVLVRPTGPINLGLVARACANFGCSDLRLVETDIPVDHEQVRTFAVHAWRGLLSLDEGSRGDEGCVAEHVQSAEQESQRAAATGSNEVHQGRPGEGAAGAPVFSSVADAVRDRDVVVATSVHRRARGKVPHLRLSELEPWIVDRGGRRAAILFGNEADGLTAQEGSYAHAWVSIETRAQYRSMNLSHAVAVVLYAMAVARDRPRLGRPDHTPASQVAVEQLLEVWLDLLDTKGFFRRASRERYEPLLRQLVGRLGPQEQDVSTLIGMFRHLRRS